MKKNCIGNGTNLDPLCKNADADWPQCQYDFFLILRSTILKTTKKSADNFSSNAGDKEGSAFRPS